MNGTTHLIFIFFTIKDFLSLCAELNIVIEKSIGLSSSGKQFDIPNSISAANLIAHEAIFLLSYKSYEPIKLKSWWKPTITAAIGLDASAALLGFSATAPLASTASDTPAPAHTSTRSPASTSEAAAIADVSTRPTAPMPQSSSFFSASLSGNAEKLVTKSTSS